MLKHAAAVAMLLSAAVFSPGFGQRIPDATAEDSPLQIDSDLVLVPTIVTNRDYKLILDLEKSQFELRVDRVVTPFGFWKETGPVSIVFVFDASNSMTAVLKQSKEAFKNFMALAHPEDEYALVLCKERTSAQVPFTSDLLAISGAIEKTYSGGSTPLYDSLQLALKFAKKGRHDRKVILVISDGQDTSSRAVFHQLREEVLESTANIYTLQFWTDGDYDSMRFEALRDLTQISGGIFFSDISPERFAEYLADLDVHQRYMLAFRPIISRAGGKVHQLEVRVRDANVRRPRVFWRRTYKDGAISPELRP